ncbi:uncharacterized protein LOC134559070 [Prinia subflava]|uniref:uncharacterized protein LOC134552788 n=1 Tax=Prinia subflava TaxID=208062 RepID=UPI002FE065C5
MSAKTAISSAVLFASLLTIAQAWLVPQPQQNVWTVLAKSLGQDHICLNQASAANPMASCLVGIPFKDREMPKMLLGYAQKLRQEAAKMEHNLKHAHYIVAWYNYIKSLPKLENEPQELELLGSARAESCFHIRNDHVQRHHRHFVSSKAHFNTHWCNAVSFSYPPIPPQKSAQVFAHPRQLPRGTFLICGDHAWAGIPSHLSGGPCTFGTLGLFSPNKSQILDWVTQNSTNGAHLLAHSRKKREDYSLKKLADDCDEEIIHWSRSKGIAITVFAPWVAIAKTLGELGHLECWVAKQSRLTSRALSNLLKDEEITRQATLQNRAAIDYLLLLHGHSCEEFEGLCCFNLTSRAKGTREALKQMENMIGDIKQEYGDWLSNLFKGWGISGWTGSILKTVLLIVFVLFVAIASLGLMKKMLQNLISSSTSPPKAEVHRVAVEVGPEAFKEEEESFVDEDEQAEQLEITVEEVRSLPREQWPTQQQWFAESYPRSEHLVDPPQFGYLR